MYKKLLSTLLAFSLAGTVFCTPFSYADEKLSYRDAVHYAVNNNLSIEKTQKQINDYNDDLETGIPVSEEMLELDPSAGARSSIGMRSMQSGLEVAQLSKDVQEEALKVSLKETFYNIEKYEKNTFLLNKQIAHMRDKFNVINLKYKLGLVSKSEFEKFGFELEKKANEQKDNKLNLDMEYRTLSKLIGIKNNKKIEYLIPEKYATIDQKSISVEGKALQASSMAPSIYAQNEEIKLLEAKLDLGLFDQTLDSIPEKNQKESLRQKDVDMRISKDNLKNAVLDMGGQIISLEDNIENTELSLENMNLQQRNIAAMVKAGTATKLQLEDLNLKLEETKFELNNMKKTHEIMVLRLEKPYLLALQ